MSYVVYKHTVPNGKVYIGVTCQALNKRWLNGLGYSHNDYFFKAIKKYGWQNIKHEILFDGLTKEEACKKEIELIAAYKSNQREYGYNMTDGGDGVNGFKHNSETLSKINNLWEKGHIPWNKGKKTSEETRAKQSQARKGKPSPRKGVKLSKEQVEKHAKKVSKPVLQYDKHGNFIKEWESRKEAALTLKINAGNIASCCTGNSKSAGGYVWKHKEE